MKKHHSFHLGATKPHNKTRGGERVKATKHNFSILQGMSVYRLRLDPKGVREPHWHANADELGYCLQGEVLVGLYATGNVREQFLVKEGEAFFIPSGALHSIENVSKGASELILQFSHEEPEDFELSSTMGLFSDAVLGNTWGVSQSVFKKMKRSTKEVFAVQQKTPSQIADEAYYASPYRFRLEETQPLISLEEGSAKLARQSVWPILKRQALYSLRLESKGMREPHWHPETAELGFVKEGKARMSILSPDGDVDTYVLNEGDIYFIPKAYPHHIENLSKKPLHFLIFFDQCMPGDVGFTASIKSFSDETLGAVMDVPSEFFRKLPKYYEDLFIVKKTNPLD